MNNKFYLNEFEKEIWLYLDGTISPERKEFWNDKMREIPELRSFYKETVEALALYDQHSKLELSEEELDKMLGNSVRSGIWEKLRLLIQPLFGVRGEEPNLAKLAFGAVITAAAVVVLLLSNKPNTVKTLSNELLNWDDSELATDIQSIDTKIKYIENDDAREYILLNLHEGDWQRKQI